MAKKKGGNDEAPKVKKGPDKTAQKVKKARNALKSGGKRGLEAFLANNADIKNHKEVEALLKKAATLPTKPPKGKRGPKQPEAKGSVDPSPQPREPGQSSFGSMKALREAYKADPENTTARVEAEAREGETVNS